MGRSQTPDLDLVKREERGETLRDQNQRRLTVEQVSELAERMSTETGRRAVARQLEESGLYADVFHPNNAEMARKAGRRSQAVELNEDLRIHCPEQWLLMHKEQLDRERSMRFETEHFGDER